MEQGENSEVSMGFDSENSTETASDKVTDRNPCGENWQELPIGSSLVSYPINKHNQCGGAMGPGSFQPQSRLECVKQAAESSAHWIIRCAQNRRLEEPQLQGASPYWVGLEKSKRNLSICSNSTGTGVSTAKGGRLPSWSRERRMDLECRHSRLTPLSSLARRLNRKSP